MVRLSVRRVARGQDLIEYVESSLNRTSTTAGGSQSFGRYGSNPMYELTLSAPSQIRYVYHRPKIGTYSHTLILSLVPVFNCPLPPLPARPTPPHSTSLSSLSPHSQPLWSPANPSLLQAPTPTPSPAWPPLSCLSKPGSTCWCRRLMIWAWREGLELWCIVVRWVSR